MSTPMPIHVQYNNPGLTAVLTEELVQQLFDAAANTVDIPASLEWSIAIVSDQEIQAINKQYRQQDKPTDVLSFRYDDTTAEIVISAERVQAQAEEYGNTLKEESAWMVVHGILHSLGWDHERSEEEAKEQRALEVAILEQCGLKCAR
jgi:probable rRNA maturation factor